MEVCERGKAAALLHAADADPVNLPVSDDDVGPDKSDLRGQARR
jgi:hypothetical protein